MDKKEIAKGKGMLILPLIGLTLMLGCSNNKSTPTENETPPPEVPQSIDSPPDGGADPEPINDSEDVVPDDEPPVDATPEPEPITSVLEPLSDDEIIERALVLGAPTNASAAKSKFPLIYQDDLNSTIYCDCLYEEDKQVDLDGCGYVPRPSVRTGLVSDQALTRAQRMEADHIVPESFFDEYEKGCPTEVSADECVKLQKVFNFMAGDLVNLRPTVGQVNGDRSNRLYGEIDRAPYQYGACQVVVGFTSEGNPTVIDPRAEIRGDLARITLYMDTTYRIGLNASYLERMELWADIDPVSTTECTINDRIKDVQGFGNPLVGKDC